MALFRRSKRAAPVLDRESSLNATPVLNQLIRVEKDENENLILDVPRRKTSLVRVVCKAFKLPPYKRIMLDEVGSYVVKLCDGTHSVREMIASLGDTYQLGKREAEVSMLSFLKQLGKRGIVALVVEESAHREKGTERQRH